MLLDYIIKEGVQSCLRRNKIGNNISWHNRIKKTGRFLIELLFQFLSLRSHILVSGYNNVPIPQLSVPSWPIRFRCLMLDSFTTQHQWASTLRTVTPTAKSIWTNSAKSTVRIWSTHWSRFFLHQKTSMVLWLHWKMRWTVSELSHWGLRFAVIPAILTSFTTQHHGNPLSHWNRNAWPHCG